MDLIILSRLINIFQKHHHICMLSTMRYRTFVVIVLLGPIDAVAQANLRFCPTNFDFHHSLDHRVPASHGGNGVRWHKPDPSNDER